MAAIRPMSLRIMSTIITFSARFLRECCNQRRFASSSARWRPRAAVPFIGREHNVSPSRVKKSSGEAEQMANSGVSMKAPYGALLRLLHGQEQGPGIAGKRAVQPDGIVDLIGVAAGDVVL